MTRKILSILLAVAMVLTIASFPVMASAATNTKRVKIMTIGDSITQGTVNQNAYRYTIYENLIQDGAVFQFIGPFRSGDFRVSATNELYNRHGGYGGAIIGSAADYRWNGSTWEKASSTYTDATDPNRVLTYGGSMNSVHYRLFAGSDGSMGLENEKSNYLLTEYGPYVEEADIVTLLIGYNDYFGEALSSNVDAVMERYETIVNKIYAINPDVSLYVIGLHYIDSLRGSSATPGNDTYVHKSMHGFNDRVELFAQEYAEEHPDRKISFISLDDANVIRGVDTPDDDLHPNASGDKKIGEIIYAGIKDEVLELNKETSDVAYNPTRVTSLTLDKTSATLKKGENLTIASTVAPADAEVITTIFTSSNESVATVDYHGRITAVGAGTATIYATALDSMRPGDTEIKKACTVTVTNDGFEKVNADYVDVFVNRFLTASDWTGDTGNITPTSTAYKHPSSSPSSSITSVESVDLGNTFSMSCGVATYSVEYKEVNDANRNNYYATMTVGKYQLRVALNGRVVGFYYNGALKAEKVFNTPASKMDKDRYTLVKDGGTVYVYRNNELLFTATVNANETVSGNVTIACKGYNINNIRDVQLKRGFDTDAALPEKIQAVSAVDEATSNGTLYGNIANIIDGDPMTGWGKNTWTNATHTVKIDLGDTYDLSNLRISWGGASANVVRSTEATIYVSTNGTTWKEVAKAGDPTFTVTNSTPWSQDGYVDEIALSTPVEAKHVRIVSTKNGGGRGVGIREVEVYGYAEEPTVVNYTINCTYKGTSFKTFDATGYVGMVSEITAPEIFAYTPLEASKTVAFTGNETEITFAYDIADYAKTVTTYTVNYVDTEGNVLAPAKTAEGYVDDDTTEYPISIEGYLPRESSQTITLTDTPANNIYTFVYTLVPEKLPLTAANVIAVSGFGGWTNGDTIDTSKDVLFDGEPATNTKGFYANAYFSGAFSSVYYVELDLGNTYDLSHIIIQGGASDWNYAHMTNYAIYTAGADHVYSSIPAGKQEHGNSITSENKVRTDRTDIKVNDVRYVKIQIINASYRRPVIGEIEVYRSMEENVERKEAYYTVNYVDEEGNTLATSKTNGGYVGDEVTETPVKVSGYTANDESKTITLVDGTNTITFTYTKNDGPQPIKPTAGKSTSGTKGATTNHTNTANSFDGVMSTYVSINTNNYDKTTGDIVTYIYEFDKAYTFASVSMYWSSNRLVAGDIYVSDDGTNWGSPVYSGTIPYVSEGNYRVVTATLPANSTGKYIKIVANEMVTNGWPSCYEVEFMGTTPAAEAPKDTTYTVNYVDTEGKTVATTKNGTGKVGATVVETAVTVDGYTVDEETKSIELVDGTNTITFTYTKIDPNAPKPIAPVKGTGANGSKGATTSSTNLANTLDGKLDTYVAVNTNNYDKSTGDIVSYTYEFDKAYAFNTITMTWTSNRLVAGDVYVSDDGENWGNPVHSGTMPYTSDGSYRIVTVTLPAETTGKYVKIVANEMITNGWPSFREIEFVGTVAPLKTVSPTGGSIRLASNKLSAGLRFAATVDKALAEIEGTYEYSDDADVKFGMFLLPKAMLGTSATLAEYVKAGGDKVLDVPAVKIYAQDEETITYTAVLINIPTANYATDIVAVPYMLTNDEYTFFVEMSKSYRGVATAARETTYSDSAIAAITNETVKAEMIRIANELDNIIDTDTETKTIIPTENDVYVMGRNYEYNELIWAGAVYEYKCTGSVAGAVITGTDGQFEVSIDGGEFVPYKLENTKSEKIIFATGLLASQEHTVRILKSNDGWYSKINVEKVVVSEDGDIVKNHSRDYDLKVEFIGDSITSGGVTGMYSTSYAYLTASALNANYNIVSRSGLGLYKNASNSTTHGMLQDLYKGTGIMTNDYDYSFDADLVVLNIGTNDGANVRQLKEAGNTADADAYKETFTEMYVEMLGIIHTANPDATIVCTGGLMTDINNVWENIEQAVADYKAANPNVKVVLEKLSAAKDMSAETSWHPGTAGHAAGASELIPILKNAMNIQ